MPPIRPASVSSKPDRRPQIWAEGRQSPPFDLRAFGRVALVLTRRTVGPKLVAAGVVVLRLALRAANGDFAAHAARLGRAGGYLPSRTAVASGLRGLAGLLTQAGRIMLPVHDCEPLAYADLLRPAQMPSVQPVAAQPVRPRRAAPRLGDRVGGLVAATAPPQPAPDPANEPTLSAIRSLMADMASAPPPDRPLRDPMPVSRPESAALPAAPPAPPPARRLIPQRWRGAATRSVSHAAAFGLGWLVAGLVLPYGAALAMIEHLQGEDLRDWH